MSSFLYKIFGNPNVRSIKEFWPAVEKINALEASFSSLTDEQVKAKTAEFRDRLSRGETLDDLLPEAFAAWCSTAAAWQRCALVKVRRW